MKPDPISFARHLALNAAKKRATSGYKFCICSKKISANKPSCLTCAAKVQPEPVAA